MKRIIKMLFTPFAILSLALGVSISINNHHEIGANAASPTMVFDSAGSLTTGIADGEIAAELYTLTNNGSATLSVKFNKNSSSANTIFNNSAGEIRLYGGSGNGGQLTFTITGGLFTGVTVNTSRNTGLSVNGGPTKTTATVSETFTATDTLTLQNVADSNNQVRMTDITMTYEEGEVVIPEFGNLDKIELDASSPALKLQYYVGETFSSEGLVVTAFDDSDPVVTKMVTDDVVYSAEGHIFVAEDVGTYTVTVSYTELEITVSTTFDVEVLPPIVFDHAGTLEDPYSPADAIKVAEKTGETPTTESFYIKGIISLVKSVDTGSYGNAEFEIKENLSDSVKFLIYRAFANSAGAPFTTATAADIKVGYEVVVYGKIVNYKGNTPETTAGQKNTANTTHVVSIDKTAATEAANAFAVNFNSAIGAICSLDGESDLIALEAEWLVQKAAFNDLVEGSRVLVQASTANSEGSDLEQFTAKYIFIANKYQSLENFVASTEVVAGVNNRVRDTNSNQMGHSLVIGLIGLTTLVGFYFINKKKQINN